MYYTQKRHDKDNRMQMMSDLGRKHVETSALVFALPRVMAIAIRYDAGNTL